MATDSDVRRDGERPCCAALKGRYLKLEEKRNALRQAVKLLEQQIDKFQTENVNLKKAYEEERVRAMLEIEAKLKESAIRVDLENEILNLKSQTTSVQENRGSGDQHESDEIVLLQIRVSEAEVEINQLKELLEKERTRGDLEQKKAEEEKKKVAEAWKLVKSLKTKSEEEKKLADFERTQAEEYRCSLEASRTEVHEAKEALVSNRSKTEEALRRLEVEKQKAEKEKKRADKEMVKAEEHRKFAEEESKKTISEKSRFDKLSQELEEQKRRNGILEKESCRITLALEKANKEKKRADIEMAKVEEERKSIEEERQKAIGEKHCAYQLSLQLEEEKRRNEALEKEIQRIKAARKLEKARKKKHADLEIEKAEKLWKYAEEERIKAISEKNRSSQLAQQLEEEMQRNEALEKEIQGIMSARQLANANAVPHDYNSNAANTDMIILKKQLKLEKMHTKHAKRVAKLRKVQNDLMKAEIYCLKKDFLQLSQRLNILDGCFFPSIEGIDASAKVSNFVELHSSKLKTKHVGKEQCEFYCQSNELAMACHTNVDGFDPSRLGLGHAGPFSGGCCSKQNSGISSELESVIGGSVRNKLQNSATYSTSTSFSDRPLVGSQGRGAFSVAKSANLTKENLQGMTVPKLSGEVTEMILKENLGVVAENNIRNLVGKNTGSPCLNSYGNDIDGAGREPAKSRQERGFRDVLESIEYVYSKDKSLGRQIEKNLSALCDMLIIRSNMPSLGKRKSNSIVDGKCLVSTSVVDLDAGSHVPKKKRNMRQKHELILQPCDNSDGLKRGADLKADSSKDAEVFTVSVSPANCSRKIPQIYGDAVDEDSEIFFENMMNGNYMKLLELDNAADEERFRIAVENPLSPTLPEIEMTNLEMHGMVESINKEVPNKKANLVPYSSFDVRNVEKKSRQTCVNQPSEGSAESEVAKGVPDCGNEGMKVSCAITSNPLCESMPKYCVVFADSKDKISRIISAMETCISQSYLVLQKDWMMHKIILAVSKEQDLLPEERACVFLSLLLHNFSIVTSLKFSDFSTSSRSLCSDSFASHVKTVMSDGEMRCLLLESCQLDTLFSVTEDFLIDRRVLLYNNMSHDANVPNDSASVIFLRDGTTIYMSMRTAAVDQLVAGSIVLASMCAAFGRIGFICEVSYRILRIHRSDSCLMLTMLHVFASLCGNKYFTMDEYSLIMTIIKSVVIFLERGNKAFGSCVFSLSTRENCECEFSEGAVSLDEVMRLLLEKLQYYTVPGIGQQHMFKSFTSSKCSSHHNVETVELDPNFVCNKSLVDFSDYLSLVELVACYMSWDWTRSKIIPQLLKMLESCMSEKFSAAIIVLLGQLGRLGLDSSGKGLMGVEELRRNLCSFLDKSTRKWSFPTQCAIILALIDFDNIDFEELSQTTELQAGTIQTGHSNLIRTWFLQLGEEQKSLSIRLFQTTDLHES